VQSFARAGIVVAALAVTGSGAAQAPVWTAQGTITALHKQSITVHGHLCLMTGSLGRAVAAYYSVGDGAKIACTRGILQKIAVLPLPPIIISVPPPSTGSGTPGLTVGGTVAITQLGDASIGVGAAAGANTTTIFTCTIDSTSPDVSGLQIGDRLTSLKCRGNPLVLTSFTRA
jgi:hypothetical protein